ncbi:MAG: C2 family cysteine protease [Gemmataceae bacterium]
MFRSLRSLFSSALASNNRKPARSPLTLENLEKRELMAAYISGGTLVVDGTTGNDVAILRRISGQTNGVNTLAVTFNGTTSVLRGIFQAVTFYGMDGDDTLRADTVGMPVKAFGGNGNDMLVGGNRNDTLDGGAGNDRLFGLAGNDLLQGGSWDDVLNGGAGNDRLFGMDGNDILRGMNGRDIAHGGEGDDKVYGDEGNDTLSGSNGNDRLWGGNGADTLFGNSGTDHLYGGAGLDLLRGGSGDDNLISIDGMDPSLETGRDNLYGEDGNDMFWVDLKDDTRMSWIENPLRDNVKDASTTEKNFNINGVRYFLNGADRTLDGDVIADPTFYGEKSNAQWEYRRFAETPLYLNGGPTALDIRQGAVGDCWLLGSLGAVVQQSPDAIRRILVDLGDGTYAVRIQGQFVRVDADLPVDLYDHGKPQPVFAYRGGQMWVAIIEKAYATVWDNTAGETWKNDYLSLSGGYTDQALRAILETPTYNPSIGGGILKGRYSSSQVLLDEIASHLANGYAVTFATGNDTSSGLFTPLHVYAVIGVNRDSSGKVVSVMLRDPNGPQFDATGEQLYTHTEPDVVNGRPALKRSLFFARMF